MSGPRISVIIPVRNEADKIEQCLKAVLSQSLKPHEVLVVDGHSRDKYEIIIVESGSTDNTYQIVENFLEGNKISEPSLKLIKEENRRGKASAINFGKSYAKGDIILVTDANSMFDKNVLKEMMPHFTEPKIGGVGGRYVVSNPDNELAASKSFYWDLEYMMRKGESVFDSACTFHGEINAWRKDIVSADTKGKGKGF